MKKCIIDFQKEGALHKQNLQKNGTIHEHPYKQHRKKIASPKIVFFDFQDTKYMYICIFIYLLITKKLCTYLLASPDLSGPVLSPKVNPLILQRKENTPDAATLMLDALNQLKHTKNTKLHFRNSHFFQQKYIFQNRHSLTP